MSVPPSFSDSTVYLRETIDFLSNYQWLYNCANTHLLVNDVFANFPREWRPYLHNLNVRELNELPFNYCNDMWPESLKQFLEKIKRFKPHVENKQSEEYLNLPQSFFKGLSVKKKHEILSLAPLINKHFETVDLIIDVGAGLGYLPQLLHKKYGYKILAIETDSKKLEAAQKRQKDLYPESQNFVKYVQHYVNENSEETIKNFITDFLKTNQNLKIGLVGLHACADLSLTMLKLFFKMENVQKLIVMPCCYHRLEKNGEIFKNFPVSKDLKNIFIEKDCQKFLSSTFLRLACQNSSTVWRNMSQEEHLRHSTDLMRRNILQLVVENSNLQMVRLTRKTKSTNNIEEYISQIEENHRIYDTKTNENIPINILADEIKLFWEKYTEELYLIEIYTAFQTYLQNICENLILLDRVLYVKELGSDCAAIKVTNEELSPRCYALVARKNIN